MTSSDCRPQGLTSVSNRPAWRPRPDLWTLDPAVLHLNHGSWGAVPRAAQEAAARLRAESEANPAAWFRALPDRVAAARRRLAAWVGADEAGFALVPNVSAGVTVALTAVDVPPGGRIVVTSHCYGAVRFAAERFARLRGATVVEVPVPLTASPDEVVALLAPAVSGASVVLVDQVTSATATVFPVARLIELCRSAGVPVIVDGAHGPGLVPLPVPEGADFWAGNFHKWACAPRGTAGLVVAPRWRSRTMPLVVSWSEQASLPERFDWQATADYVPWLAAGAALDMLDELDWPAARAAVSAMLADGADEVANAAGGEVPELAAPAATMRLVALPPSVRVEDKAAEEALRRRIAREAGAEVNVTVHAGQAFLRLSAHAYNGPGDYELLAARLPVLF
ncbi:aminotransferase class V-fold PLP-dependent enzyme [Jiangella alkaliphila]|uniref:Isopenicillin-N epimerase n=1 Tax=Jiangella alkaliphila TaxID=419479 RepID=A0A1H2LV29_9ACTN|nr:aminotransferase class V-fold PLP-dependent enzyme [Jiangella alkaliphila]SDU84847.1 isopenicillin-N epimerase [Jiangella alkaliphila]